MPDKVSPIVDTNKSDGTPVMKFSDQFVKSFDDALADYNRTLNYLSKLIRQHDFSDDYGVCNCRYQLIYITPHDISSYIGYLFKAISDHIVNCSIVDLEKLSVELAKRFVYDNTATNIANDNVFANSTYSDPRTQTLMDLLVQLQNVFFDRCVYSKYEMEQRAKSLESDFKKFTDMNFVNAMKAVVEALPKTIKDVMYQGMTNGVACCDCDLIMTYIEMFILFVCSVNTCTLTQMIGYAEPRSTFIRKEYSKYQMEQFNETSFNGFITECCILKTNEMNIRSRIPFDCNMRNIVLQDVTPMFKDTKSALHFMLKDNRSPINVLLIKYSTSKRMANHDECIPAMKLFEPYFRPKCDDSPLSIELDRVGFLTDVNWLDKIAYGNQFMDGNYRLDAVGNENRHPIVTTLDMLQRMYCGCDLKTNEELADHILKIAGLMHSVIEANWSTMNRQLTTDILCVLGDCFTRCVLKLYHNNCVVITADDDMPNTMIPGYTYCEQFVVEADVTVTTSQNTAPKTGGLSKLTSIIRQFANWVQSKFKTFGLTFAKTNDSKIKWIQSHQKLNDEIGQVIGEKKMIPTLSEYQQYNVPYKAMTDKLGNIQNVLNQMTANKDIDENEFNKLKKDLYPGDDATATAIVNETDANKRKEMIRQYVLFGNINPSADVMNYNGPMSQDQWRDLVSTLTESGKLINELTDKMTKALQTEISNLDKVTKEKERADQASANATQTQQQTSQQQQSSAGVDPQQIYDFYQQVLQDYQMNALNTLGNTMFNRSYAIYKKIVDAYSAQSKTKTTETTPQSAENTTHQPESNQTGNQS